MKVEKPWGYYEVLSEGVGYKVKRLGVDPGHKLSLQRHKYREEHWYVVLGTAVARISTDGNHFIDAMRRPGTFIDIEKNMWHRLINQTLSPLVVIEVQRGNYLEEDDIERIEDDYDRI